MTRSPLATVPNVDAEAAPVRVATYTRISTDEERQPNSLEAQAERLEAFVHSQPGWQIERHYEDQFTGTAIERPALTRLLRDAKLGRFDLLLVYRVDRLARSIRGLAQIIDELGQTDITFRSATEPFDTGTPAGRMMVQMLGVFAEFERAMIVERILAGQERKAARGGWCGGRRPFGYDIAADRDHLEPNPTEAPLVPVIFDLYAKRKLGSAAIAHWLNERGYRTKDGRSWSRPSVLTVLRNRSYLGQIYYRGNWYPAPHEPLIPEALFERGQRILAERGENKSTRRSNASDYLLTGRVRCGRCGQAYLGTAATDVPAATPTTPASRDTATARNIAPTIASPPTNLRRRSSAASKRFSPTTVVSTEQSIVPMLASLTSSPKPQTSVRPSSRSCARRAPHSTATSARSSAAPCPRKRARPALPASPSKHRVWNAAAPSSPMQSKI